MLEMKNTFLRIPRLIAKKVLGTSLSAEEEEELNAWMQKEENRKTFEEIGTLKWTKRLLELEREQYGEKMAEHFFQQQRRVRRQRMYRLGSLWFGIAAMVLLVLSVFPFHILKQQEERSLTLAETTISIKPGEVKATLTLADGREFSIDESNGRQVEQLIDSARMEAIEGSTTNRSAYHKLTVPRGGEFSYQLADGSKVWINSESELRFPESFGEGDRHVYLKGEAYFDVVKDTSHPFIVSTSKGDIRVYGTSFNATDYANRALSVVLVQGRISFLPQKGEEVQLLPSQRMEYNEKTGGVKVETVDVSTYTAWVEHYFIFQAQSLEEIMNTLSRWYDFNAVFEHDNLRNIRLSGRLYRHEDIRTLLDSYEQIADVKFQIKGNNIIITK